MRNYITPFSADYSYYGSIASQMSHENPYSIEWTTSSVADYFGNKLNNGAYYAGKTLVFKCREMSIIGVGTIYCRFRSTNASDITTTVATIYPADVTPEGISFVVPADCAVLRFYCQLSGLSGSVTAKLLDAELHASDDLENNIFPQHLADIDYYGTSEAVAQVTEPRTVSIVAASSVDYVSAEIMTPMPGRTIYIGWEALGKAPGETTLKLSSYDASAVETELLDLDSSDNPATEQSVLVPADSTYLKVKLYNTSGVTYPNEIYVEGLYLDLESHLPHINITTQPTSRDLVVGEISDSIAVIADSSDGSAISYQWYSNNVPATGGTPISGAISAAYELPGTLAVGLYYYYCILTTSTASPVTTSIVTVNVKATISDIKIHKIFESNLPATAPVGEEHWYMTLNPETGETKLFISRQNGALVQIGGAQSQAENEYYNPYTQAAIDERIDEIKALQYGDTITFAVITDIHYRADELSRAGIDSRIDRTKDYQMLAKQIPIDFVAFTGDALQESAAFDAVEPRLSLMTEALNKAKSSVYFARGNHDLNSSGVVTMTSDLVIGNKLWFSQLQTGQKVFADSVISNDQNASRKAHFYVDDFANKHRMIFINTADMRVNEDGTPYISGGLLTSHNYVYTTEQIRWLLDYALDMTDRCGWVVSFFAHHLPYIGAPGSEPYIAFHGYGNYTNTGLFDVLQAFIGGTPLENYVFACYKNDGTWVYDPQTINHDFSLQGPVKVTGFFTGHIHDDCYYKMGALNSIANTCTCASRRTSWTNDPSPSVLPPARSTLETAMSVNLFIINKTTRTVNCVKIGSKRDNDIQTSSDYSFSF